MKIALCFSGQPRAFEKGYEYYKRNLLDHYDVDVHIHAWNSKYNDQILDLYKPLKYKFQDYLTVDCSKYTRTPIPLKHPQFATYSMYYSLNEVRKLIDGDYDWVIKTRTDYALNTKFNFEQLDNSKVYVPDDYIPEARDRANDQFAFGSMANMDKYMSTFENLDQIYDAGAVFNGEDLLHGNLMLHELTGDKLFYINVNNPFPPNQWGGMQNSLIRDDLLQWR
jgi:hypothetical protein